MLKGTIDRVGRLERRVRELRERLEEDATDVHLCESLDVALLELDSKFEKLVDRALDFGVPAPAAGNRRGARTGPTRPDRPKGPSALAARIVPGCEACAKSLCALVRAARSISDAASERIACALVHTLEKLLWQLRPKEVPANLRMFSRICGQSQPQACFS